MNDLTVLKREACPCCYSRQVVFQREMGGAQILECIACGSAFSTYLPRSDEIVRIYNTLYQKGGVFDSHRREVNAIQDALKRGQYIKVGWERKYFFARCRPRPGDRLLDIGCGTGLFLCAASQRGWATSGLEISNEGAELGRAVHGQPIHYGQLDELPNEAFKAVTAWEVLEHLPEPHLVLKSILRLLQPGGIFAGSVPNYARPRYRYGENLGPISMPPIHINFWSPSALKATLQTAGFCEVEVSAPRVAFDLLKPLHSLSLRKFARFFKVAVGIDVITSVFFMGRRPK